MSWNLTTDSLRFAVEDLTVCSRKRLFVTGQHDWRVTFLAGQVTILARHCPLAGRYFEPQKVFLFSVKDVLPAPNPAARLDLSQPHPRGSFLPSWEWQEEERPGTLGTRLVSSQTSQQCHFKNCEWGLYTQAV